MRNAAVILGVLVTVGSARGGGDDPPPVNFDEHIVPIFREHCLDCHRGSRAKNGLALDTLGSVLEGGSGGASIVPGDAAGSLLYQLVAHEREPVMPFEDDKLPDEVIATIRTWIDAGAPETAASRPVVTRPTVAPVAIEPGASNEPTGAPAMPGALRREPFWWSARASAVTALAASPWAPVVAVAGHGQIALYHAGSRALLGVVEYPDGVVNTLRFSRNGALLLAGGGRGAAAGRVLAWDVATGERVLDLGDEPDVVLAADISNDHQRVALGGPDGVVRVYATATGAPLYELTKHTDWITAIAFSPDGVLLATGDRAGGVWVWEAATSREFHALPAHAGRVSALGWRLDSNVLASAGEDGAIRLFEMENGGQIKAWTSHGGVLGLTFLRDGRLATCGRDRIARLWDANGAEQRSFPAASDLATAVAVTHDAAGLAVGDWGGGVRLFATADGSELGGLRANPPALAEREIAVADAALAGLREQVSTHEARAREAAEERARRAEASSAARSTLTGATQTAEALEAEAAALEAAAVAARPSDELVTALEAARAALGRAERELASADADATRAAAEMVAAQRAVVAAATALADAAEDQRAAAAERKAAADTLLTGATAVAQLAAETAARRRVEHQRCAADVTERAAVLTPRQTRAEEAHATATAARGRATEARAAATAETTRVNELERAAATSDEKAQAAEAALTGARDALARGEARAHAARAAWDEQKARIAEAGGRVE